MDHWGAVIPAGGVSARFGKEAKLFVPLGGKPVIVYSIQAFLQVLPAEHIAIAVHRDHEAELHEILQKYFPREADDFPVTQGGSTRTESVWKALQLLPSAVQLVSVHDAARPLVTPEMIRDTCVCAERFGAAVAVKKITDTLKRLETDGMLSSNAPSRDELAAAETPQVFRRDLLEKALEHAVLEQNFFTDDAAAVEYYTGVRAMAAGHAGINFKITIPSDKVLAEALLHYLSLCSQTKNSSTNTVIQQ